MKDRNSMDTDDYYALVGKVPQSDAEAEEMRTGLCDRDFIEEDIESEGKA